MLYLYSIDIRFVFHSSSSKYLEKYSVSSFGIKKQNGFQFKNTDKYKVDSCIVIYKHYGEKNNSNSKYLNNYTHLIFF